MTKNNIANGKHILISDIESNKLKCHKLPNHGEKFSGYRENVSVYNFEEYLYSLRHLNDIKNNGGIYLG